MTRKEKGVYSAARIGFFFQKGAERRRNKFVKGQNAEILQAPSLSGEYGARHCRSCCFKSHTGKDDGGVGMIRSYLDGIQGRIDHPYACALCLRMLEAFPVRAGNPEQIAEGGDNGVVASAASSMAATSESCVTQTGQPGPER